MPIAGQNWLIEGWYGREGHERFYSETNVTLDPYTDRVRIAMAACVLITDSLRDMQIDKAEVGDGFDIVITIRRSG